VQLDRRSEELIGCEDEGRKRILITYLK
jgi:hypothetical protein